MAGKLLISLKPFINTDASKKPRNCITCESVATQEACFDVGEDIIAIESYCKECSEKAII
jgi:hypothetical protein